MKLTLIVTTKGARHGHQIPVIKPTFVIGRDPECQLRPASDKISRRHCEISVRGDKVAVQDLQSMNGTFVNGQQVDGCTDLNHGDSLRVGPLEFEVCLTPEVTGPVSDDEIAALLLSQDGSEADVVPKGDTIPSAPAVPRTIAPSEESVDAASAAKALLKNYQRRPR